MSQPFYTSWYGGGEKLNRYTASGQEFRPEGFTCAHRTLPMGTKLELTHKGRHTVVTVNDRGPAAWTGRNLDLSRGAAQALGVSGLAHIQGRVIPRSEHTRGITYRFVYPLVDMKF